jgi:micrococcal nuclease
MDNLLEILVAIFLGIFPISSESVEVGSMPVNQTVEVVEVIDGDTIRVLVDGQIESVRYIGIDTPEPYSKGDPECFSLEASQRNRELVEGQEVTLVSDTEDRDKYGRLLRYVYVDEVLINEVLISEGYATTLNIPPNSLYANVFRQNKEAAKLNNLGLWSACADE